MTGAGTCAEDTMVDFVVERADALIGLSRRVRVSPTVWREVASIDRVPNPICISTGLHLRIPTRLMRREALDATLVSVSGDADSGDS